MHTHIRIALISSLLMLAVTIQAQSRHKVTKSQVHTPEQMETACLQSMLDAYTDSLSSYKHRVDSLMQLTDSLRSEDECVSDNKYYRLFSPFNFYHRVALDQFRIKGDADKDTTVAQAIDKTLFSVYMKRPDLVRSTDSQLYLTERETPKNFNIAVQPQKIKLTNHALPVITPTDSVKTINRETLNLYVSKPHFWTFSGDYFLQFLQNHVSENWYKGGSDSYSMLGTVTLQYNYNNKQKIKFENKLEMKLGLQTMASDTVNKFKTTEDLLRYTGKLGLQAHKNWYYTMQVLAYTQFMQGRKDNKEAVYSDFMSPFNLNISLGMDYNYTTKNKRFSITAHLAPLAFNLKYVGREDLEKSFGITDGRHTLEDFGSTMTTEFTWKPFDMVQWKARLYAYTTYHKLETEFENTITFTFNRYLSANMFLYPRFDDSIVTKDGDPTIQFKEYVSFGFSYSM